MRWLTSVLATIAMIIAVPALALALSVEDVKKMAASGLDDNTIINIINTSGQQFPLTADEEAELKAAGVSDRVITALKATAGSSGTTGGTTTPGGPVPTPVQVGNLGRTIAQGARTAKQTWDIESNTARKLAEQKAYEAQRAQLQLAFQDIDRMLRDWAATDKWAALATCHNFLAEFKPPVTAEEFYGATFCKGAAFHDLELHNLAAPILKDVVLMGSEKSQFVPAFEMLVESAESASYFPPGMAELDAVYVEDKPKPFQDQFNYFVGRFYQETLKNYDRAVTLLSRVSPESKLYPKAMYATAVMQASPELSLYATAVENFQTAITASEALGTTSVDDERDKDDIIELSYLALARIAYEAANYDGALYYYNKVDTFSPRYPQALFETAWTYAMKGDERNALGTFHSVSSPYYQGYYFPDLWVLEGNAYLSMCRYDLARQALQTFSDLYLAKLPLLTQFIAEQNDPAAIYDNVVAAVEAGDGGPVPQIFAEAILSNVRFYNLYQTIDQLDAEVARLKETADQLGPYGQDLLARVEGIVETRRFEAGIETQNILRGIEDELREWDVTMTEVSIEIDLAERDLQEKCLQLTAQGLSCEFETEEETVLFLVADDWQFWPFEGEYWVDEVGNYKSYLGDRCRQVDALSQADTGE